MRKLIIFHGPLKKLLPEPFEVDANSPLEAMRGLIAQHPHLQRVMNFEDRPLVQIVGFEARQSLTAVTDVQEFHVVPAMMGAGGNGGFAKIVIGAIIVAAAVVSFGGGALAAYGLSAGFAATNASLAGSLMISLGSALIFGGLLSFLSPAPPRDTGQSAAADPEASKYLGAGQNTVRIGTRIAMGYGEDRVYGHFLSFDIKAVDVAV